MPVGLTGARRDAPVVEAEPVDFSHAGSQRLEVAGRQPGLLGLVGACDDQEGILQNRELVEQRDVRRGDVRDEELIRLE